MWNPFKRTIVLPQARAVTQTPLTQQEQQVRTMIAREMKGNLRTRQGLVLVCVVSMTTNTALAVALAGTVPLIRIVPMMMQARKDGSTRVEPVMSMMSVEDAQDPVKRATMWQYVEWREGFTRDTAKFRFDFVVALSSGDVGEAYSKWYAFTNPDSPQAKYSKNNGTVTITYDTSDYSSDPNIFVVNFYREVHVPGQISSKSHWSASIHYKIMEAIPAIERGTINPSALRVTDYVLTETDDPGNKS